MNGLETPIERWMDILEPRPRVLPEAAPADDLDRLLKVLDHGVIVVEEGRLAVVNPALARISGRRESALIGMKVSDLLADPELVE